MTISRSNRIAPLTMACLTIALGLALRGYGYHLGLPFEIVKYGGSVLWGAMVLFIVAAIMPGATMPRVAALAMTVAGAVELFRLVHTPWLDALRLTTPGALLLGRVFSPWNIAAYAAGIALAAALPTALTRTASPRPGTST
jgi:hypothetical protein